MELKQLKDGFTFEVIERKKAIKLFESGKEVFKLYDDGSEALIDNELDFIDNEVVYGIEIGFNILNH